jgi:NAD(P)-dependent dehydrogenase (short-subunit alcohol dehydrogenase family)
MVDDHAADPVAVITGASSGIGAATARALAAQGYRLALLARRVDRLQQLATELGNGTVAISADVTERDALLAAADRVQQELGGADVQANNAGVMLLGPFGTEQREEARRMVEVNLLGAMTATEVFLNQLRDGGGDLINICSPNAGAADMATRRSNGEGSLCWNEARQRWVGRASLGYNADGKRRIGTVSARTKTEARTRLRALLRDHDDGLPTQRAYTVGDAVEAWLMHGLVGRDPNTVANRTSLARAHLIPGLGKRRLAELTAEEIDSWLADKPRR